MELFVRCAGDLATVEGPVVVVTSVRSPLVSYVFVCEALLISKFFCTMAIPLRSGRVEFLRGADVSRTPRVGRSLS
jgi:hypothetical protein